MGLTTKEIEEVFSKLAVTKQKLENLERVSQRQSAMLAAALKEKNDALAGKKDHVDRLIERLFEKDEQLTRLLEQLNIAQGKLRDIQNSAKVLFRLIGQ